jgi:hypothetical protein
VCFLDPNRPERAHKHWLNIARNHRLFLNTIRISSGPPPGRKGAEKGSKKPYYCIFTPGKAVRNPNFCPYLSLTAHFKGVSAQSSFTSGTVKFRTPMICCTYVRDCGVPLEKAPAGITWGPRHDALSRPEAKRAPKKHKIHDFSAGKSVQDTIFVERLGFGGTTDDS